MANDCVNPKKAQELVCWRCGTPSHRVNDCKVATTRLPGCPAHPLRMCISRGMRQLQPEEVVEVEELEEVEEAEEV